MYQLLTFDSSAAEKRLSSLLPLCPWMPLGVMVMSAELVGPGRRCHSPTRSRSSERNQSQIRREDVPEVGREMCSAF